MRCEAEGSERLEWAILCIVWEAYEITMNVDKRWYSDIEISVSVCCTFLLS